MKPRTADELAAWLAQEDAINAYANAMVKRDQISPRYDSGGDLYGGRMADESSCRNHPANVALKARNKPEDFPL